MAKIPRKMSSYRLRAEVSEAVRLMADAGQVSQQEIVEEAVRLLVAKKKGAAVLQAAIKEVTARRSMPQSNQFKREGDDSDNRIFNP